MVKSLAFIPAFLPLQNALHFDEYNTIICNKTNLRNLQWKFIDVFKEPLLRVYLPFALDICNKTNLSNLQWKFIVFKEPLLRMYLPLALDIHPNPNACNFKEVTSIIWICKHTCNSWYNETTIFNAGYITC